MKKSVILLLLLAVAGLGSVWYLAAAQRGRDDEEASRKLRVATRDYSGNKEAFGKFFEKAVEALRNAEPVPEKLPVPPPTEVATSEDEWAQKAQKVETIVQNNQLSQIESDKEILANPQLWKEQEREREKERQLRQLARLEDLRLKEPERYEERLIKLEAQQAERAAQFETRLEERFEKVKERVEQFNASGS